VASSGTFRELLFADLALQYGVAAADVAAALRRHWETREDSPVSVGEVLVASGALDSVVFRDVEAEVAREIDAAGDVRAALVRRGGIDRTIHTSLGPATSGELTRGGTGMRAPLRDVAPGRYEDFRLVGKGGMGVVYLALDTELNRRVAFKMVMPDPRASKDTPAPETPLQANPPTQDKTESVRSFEELKLRFLQEAWITGAMEHPGVVPVYELGQTDRGIPYYTMRYVLGERTLATAIEEAGDLDARLALLEPFLKACDTIRYAHSRDVLHRDLKPDNIALGEFGEAIVLDWGLSKMQGGPDFTGGMWRTKIEEWRKTTDLQTVAGAMGTPGYMAPEAALGDSAAFDTQSDIYSLGAILFQILTGRLPFEFHTFVEYVQQAMNDQPPQANEVDPGVPGELAAVCTKALATTKEDRFESVDVMAAAIRRWQTEGAVDREVAALLENAEQEVKAARSLTGNLMVWHLERAGAACNKLLHIRRGHERARELFTEIKRMRESGIRERVRSDRRRLLQTGGVLVLAIAAIATLVVLGLLAEEREAAELRVQEVLGEVNAERSRSVAARSRVLAVEARVARIYAAESTRMLAEGRAGPARLLAAQGALGGATPATWAALAAADARWAPNLMRLLRSPAKVVGLRFGPRGENLFVFSDDGKLRVFDLATGDVKRTLTGLAGPIAATHLSSDGRRLFAGGPDGLLTAWDLEDESGEREWFALSHDDDVPVGVTAIVTSPGDAFVYAGYEDGGIRAFNIVDGSLLLNVNPDAGPVTALVFVADGFRGMRLLSAGATGALHSWFPMPMTRQEIYAIGPGPASLQISGDGSVAYACSREHVVTMLELDDATVVTVMERRDLPRAKDVVLNPGLTRLWSRDSAGVIRCLDLGEGKIATRLDDVPDGVGLAYEPTRKLLAAASGTGDVRIWDLGARTGWSASVLSGDRSRVFLARPFAGVVMRSTRDGRKSKRIDGLETTVTALACDVSGKLLFGAGLDGELRVWLPESAERYRTISGLDHPVTALAYIDETDRLVTGLMNGDVYSWDWRRKRKVVLRRSQGDDAPIARLAAAGGRVYAGDTDGRILCWDVVSGAAITTIPKVDSAVAALAVARDGQRFCIATADGRLLLRRGREVVHGTLPQASRPLAMWFGEDGIEWRSVDGRLWLWRADGTKPAATRPSSPALRGAGLPWILRDPLRRLIEFENHFGLMLNGLVVEPVPMDRYDPRPTRLEPWSHD